MENAVFHVYPPFKRSPRSGPSLDRRWTAMPSEGEKGLNVKEHIRKAKERIEKEKNLERPEKKRDPVHKHNLPPPSPLGRRWTVWEGERERNRKEKERIKKEIERIGKTKKQEIAEERQRILELQMQVSDLKQVDLVHDQICIYIISENQFYSYKIAYLDQLQKIKKKTLHYLVYELAKNHPPTKENQPNGTDPVIGWSIQNQRIFFNSCTFNVEGGFYGIPDQDIAKKKGFEDIPNPKSLAALWKHVQKIAPKEFVTAFQEALKTLDANWSLQQKIKEDQKLEDESCIRLHETHSSQSINRIPSLQSFDEKEKTWVKLMNENSLPVEGLEKMGVSCELELLDVTDKELEECGYGRFHIKRFKNLCQEIRAHLNRKKSQLEKIESRKTKVFMFEEYELE